MNEELLRDYTTSFFGYGVSWKAPIWFVGPEEGGGGIRREIEHGDMRSAEAELQKRLAVWKERGQRPLENAKEFLPRIGINKWFGPQAKSQRTWIKLIRVLAAARYAAGWPNIPDLLEYQRNCWGDVTADACDLSLFPLPSPKRDLWAYSQSSRFPEFANRLAYANNLLQPRSGFLRNQMQEFRPSAVIFYGSGAYDRKLWELITGQSFGEEPLQVDYNGEIRHFHIYSSVVNNTQCFAIPHPNTHGMCNVGFEKIGQFIGAHLPAL